MSRPLIIQNYFDPFHKYLEVHTGINKEMAHLILPYMEIRSFKIDAIILQEGEIDNYFNLVMKGMLSKYVTLKNNRKIIIQLATEGHFIHSETSFHVRRPSDVALKAIESSILIRLHHNKMEQLLLDHPWVEEPVRLLVTQMAVYKDIRHKMLMEFTPRERFLTYMKENPHMFQRVSQRVLSSYLGINPETFSRLKHLLYKRSF